MELDNIGFEDIDLNGDDQEEKEKEMMVKRWLLDAAIYQFSKVSLFTKKRVYLPDEVFYAPGMTEDELLNFLIIRGASRRCIRYAMNKYSEAKHTVTLDEITDSSRDSSSRVTSSTENTELSEFRSKTPLDFLLLPLRRLHSIIRKRRDISNIRF